MEELRKKLANWIRTKIVEAGKEGAVVGLSGGLDSAVTAALCKEAMKDKVLGLIMPCQRFDKDIEDARKFANDIQIETEEIVLDDTYKVLVEEFKKSKIFSSSDRIALANIKPRLRMITLYYFAQRLNYLVVGTGNKSELMVGYFTKYGDGGVDILPLGNLVKTRVRELAHQLGIPLNIIEKPPSAGLWPGQTDEDELRISYEELDKFLLGETVDKEHSKYIKGKIKTTYHKRELPPSPDF